MRRLIILGLLVIGARTASAQVAGVKGGFTSSKFSSSTTPAEGRLASFGGGAFVQLGGTPGLQIELLALTKGAKIADANSDNGTSKIKINYAEIPVNALLRVPFGPYIFGGPAIALETGCQKEITQNNLKISDNCEGQNVFNRHKLEWSGLVGAGLQRTIMKHMFFVEARQEFGLRNIDSEGGTVKNRSFGVFVGYGNGMARRH